jgi:benzoate-CoA ligase
LASDRTFSTSKLFFAYGLGNALYFPFGVGASTVLLAERPSAEKVFEIVTRHRPTIFFAVPAVYAAMLQAPEATQPDLRSIRCAVSAGEALPAPLWERFRERFGIPILDGIGSTEMLHMFISNRSGDVVPGSSGKIVPGYSARIVDENAHEVSPGQMGELQVCGESAAAGYWKRPELTEATFRGDWTVTGDKYICDERGYYWYSGRSDDMLKVSGLWVSPVEVETALLAHPAVLECAVVGATDSDGLTKPKAFVVLKNPLYGPAAILAELRDLLHSRLPGYKVPQWIVSMDRLPRTATGKIQRFKLREAASQQKPEGGEQ